MALPVGYTQIPFLESTGTQYIDLGLNWSIYHAIEVDAEILSLDDSVRLIGAWDSRGINRHAYAFGARNQSAGKVFVLTIGLGDNTPQAFSSPYSSGRHVWKTTLTPNAGIGTVTFKIDGVTVDSATYYAGVTSSSVSYYLFGSHMVNSSQSLLWESGNMRIYEAKITNAQTGTVLRHLFPAKRDADGVLGMYDTAYDRFYTNAGSGSFNSGGIEPPSSLTVSSDITVGQTVSITWGASPAEGVTGYVLERSVNGGAYTSVYSGDGFFYSDMASSGWTTVQYRVKAVAGADESPWIYSGSRSVVDPSAPVSPNFAAEYRSYFSSLLKPFKKVVRLEFLQPDDTVAFALGGIGQKFRIPGRDTRTFLQSGSVSVNLANGSRRKASVVLANRDGSFDYAVNKLWFGQRLRISMGMRLPNGEDFYFPMGVFYVENPSALLSPGEKTTTLNLTDKWAYLDGSLFGNLEAAYSVNAGTNIYSAIDSLLQMSKYTGTASTDVQNMIDPTPAAYTSYFNGRTYSGDKSDGAVPRGTTIAMTDTPYTITENRGSTMGALILKLNEMLAGWIGYDATGTLRLEPSEDDVDDADKPVLFAFTPENSMLLSHSSVAQNTAVYNDVTVAGQGLTGATVWARAVNADPASDTNIDLIGRRIFVEEKSDYWNTEQCAALARWMLKRKTVLQKSVTIECGQMFHLIENHLVSVKRTDKEGSPIEKHLIQGFTIPIGETGSMSITATSVTDIPDFTITTSVS